MNSVLKRILVLASAVLTGLSFGWDHFACLIWVALVPLLFVLDQEAYVREAGKICLWYAISCTLIWTSWLTSLYPMTFLGFNRWSGLVIYLGWIIFALVLAVPVWFILFLGWTFTGKDWMRALIMASLWTLMEWLMERGGMGFPWFRFSLPLAGISWAVPLASVIGSIGLTFVLIWMNAMLAKLLWRLRKDWKTVILPVVSLGLAIAAVFAYGIWFHFQGNDDGRQMIITAILQGNVRSEAKWKEGSEWNHFAWHVAQTEEAMEEGAALILWPETAVPLALNQAPEMIGMLEDLTVKRDVALVVGAFYEQTDNMMEDTIWQNWTNGYYNGLYLFPKHQLYAKQRLVPIGEYMPRWMMNMLPLLREFQLANQLTPAKESVLLTFDNMKIGSLICFESIFPDLTRRHVRNGANVIVIASNDAWYQGSAEIRQHVNHAIFRAVESNRYVIRGANTGISMVIDPKGNVVASMGEEDAGILYAEIRLTDEVSIYHRYPYIIIALSLIIVLSQLRTLKKERWKELWHWMKYRWMR